MIIELFGLMDFLAAMLLVFDMFGLSSWRFLFLAAAYLGVKAYAFKGDWMSMVDLACAIYFALLMFDLRVGALSILFTLWLLYKVITSWLIR